MSVNPGGSDWRLGSRPEQITWRVDSPRLPHDDVSRIEVSGRFEVWDGGEVGTTTIDGFKAEVGESIEIEGHRMEIVQVDLSKSESHGGSVAFVAAPDSPFITEVATRRGEFGFADQMMRRSLPHWPEDPSPGYWSSFQLPKAAENKPITFNYMTGCSRQVVPFHLTFSVTTESRKHGWWDHDEAPSRHAPADEDWGEPLPDGQRPVVEIRQGEFIERDDHRRYPEMSVPIVIDCPDGRQPIATSLWISDLTDGRGRDFLRDVPMCSDQYRPLRLESSWSKDRGKRYGLGLWSIGPVDVRGHCRVAFGTDEVTTVIPSGFSGTLTEPTADRNKPFGTPIEIEGLSLIPLRAGDGFLEFKAVGNAGRILEVEALDESGHVIATKTGATHSFYSKESWFYFESKEPVSSIASWKIRHFRTAEWLDVPFAISASPPLTESGE
ncbi:hypothetical protein [Haloferula helveola]